MTNAIFISADSDLLTRWTEAFPQALIFAHLEDVSVASGEVAITWLHLPTDTSLAKQLVSKAAAKLAPARVVALSDTPSDEQALELMECGAAGYCHSHAGTAMLQQVATVVSNQGLWVGPGLLTRLIRSAIASKGATNADTSPSLEVLSSREQEVALAVAAGASNKEIARSLAITERTVKAHLSAIFLKLGVRDRLQLALLLSAQR